MSETPSEFRIFGPGRPKRSPGPLSPAKRQLVNERERVDYERVCGDLKRLRDDFRARDAKRRET